MVTTALKKKSYVSLCMYLQILTPVLTLIVCLRHKDNQITEDFLNVIGFYKNYKSHHGFIVFLHKQKHKQSNSLLN